MTSTRGKVVVRRALTSAALAAVLGGGLAGAAHASDEASGVQISPGHEGSVPTWFWGHTKVCVKNLVPAGGNDISYNWWSSTSHGDETLQAGETRCMYRSFAGFRVGFKNLARSGEIVVFNPEGPG